VGEHQNETHKWIFEDSVKAYLWKMFQKEWRWVSAC